MDDSSAVENEVKFEVIEITDKSGSDEDDVSPKPKQRRRPAIKRDPIQCTLCAKMFNKTYNFKAHMRRHTGEQLPKNFQCNVCANMFHTNCMLKRHLKSHLGEERERKYNCTECGKAYTQVTHLKDHELKLHGKGEKRFTCMQCDSAFYRKSDYDRHYRIHTGEKNYTCTICTKSFTQKCNLDSHIKTHLGDKKFECIECDKKYISNASLRRHIKRHDIKRLKQEMKRETEHKLKIPKGKVKEYTISSSER